MVGIGLALLVASILIMSVLLSVSAVAIAAALLLTYVGFSLFQTAMINAVSQTLAEEETGIGMGLFNLVGIISGAVGTALVGKVLTGRWFDVRVLPIPGITKGYGYSNVMLVFSVVVILGGILYLRSFRGMKVIPNLKQSASGG